MACLTKLTYIYSSPSYDALYNLIESIRTTFYTNLKLEDMFFCGVFCNVDVYANYRYYDANVANPPAIFLCNNSDESSRMEYVEEIIHKVLVGEIEKPDWMIYVEENATCGGYPDPPSTFLYLVPKEEKYKKFGDELLNFLYSPNLMSTLKKN